VGVFESVFQGAEGARIVGATLHFYIYNTNFLCDNTTMAKQKLSAKARADKKKRDTRAAKTPKRRKRKAQNQRIGQRSNSDIHHTKSGGTKRISIKKNRGNYGNGTKREG
jgi:hypothetical protein